MGAARYRAAVPVMSFVVLPLRCPLVGMRSAAYAITVGKVVLGISVLLCAAVYLALVPVMGFVCLPIRRPNVGMCFSANAVAACEVVI